MRMLQALLKDRFQVVIHSETKKMPVYALVLARKDGKLGENLTESKEGGCTVPDPNQPPPLLRPGGKVGCGGAIMSQRAMTGESVPMTELARSLSLLVGRTVIDKTGLTAKYDLHSGVHVGREPRAPRRASGGRAGGFVEAAAVLGTSGAARIEARIAKGPVEVFVVDRAEKPSEN